MGKFRCNRKKVFKGHSNAGYACQVGFSPDGRFVTSGDGDGKLFFWDWKTCRIFKTSRLTTRSLLGASGTPWSRARWPPARGTGPSSTGTYPYLARDVTRQS